MNSPFESLSRQEFRRYFQPSRLVMCVVRDSRTDSGVNVITLSFCMYCSYKPPMMAIAVHDINASHALIHDATEFVLAVPGEELSHAAMECGWESVKSVDKVKSLGLDLVASETVGVPGLRGAIANVELVKRSLTPSGDHVVAIGEALKFGVNKTLRPRPLLSVGPDIGGYRVLEAKGMHRIAVVDD
jgi:flavin reductase (DIM6/NTAB) family NADH-FMN oxidoreductase RutF